MAGARRGSCRRARPLPTTQQSSRSADRSRKYRRRICRIAGRRTRAASFSSRRNEPSTPPTGAPAHTLPAAWAQLLLHDDNFGSGPAGSEIRLYRRWVRGPGYSDWGPVAPDEFPQSMLQLKLRRTTRHGGSVNTQGYCNYLIELVCQASGPLRSAQGFQRLDDFSGPFRDLFIAKRAFVRLKCCPQQ